MVVKQRHPLTAKETRLCLASLRQCMHSKDFQKIDLFNDFPRIKRFANDFLKTTLEILDEEDFKNHQINSKKNGLFKIAITYEIYFTI
jgi:hypothetical protein